MLFFCEGPTKEKGGVAINHADNIAFCGRHTAKTKAVGSVGDGVCLG